MSLRTSLGIKRGGEQYHRGKQGRKCCLIDFKFTVHLFEVCVCFLDENSTPAPAGLVVNQGMCHTELDLGPCNPVLWCKPEPKVVL